MYLKSNFLHRIHVQKLQIFLEILILTPIHTNIIIIIIIIIHTLLYVLVLYLVTKCRKLGTYLLSGYLYHILYSMDHSTKNLKASYVKNIFLCLGSTTA